MKTLHEIHEDDRRAFHDTRLQPEQFRMIAAAGVPILRERSRRVAFPTRIINDPGVLESREVKVVDIGEAEHGESGTGGTFDTVDFSNTDEVAYAIWKSVQVPWRKFLAAKRFEQLDLLRKSGEAATGRVVEKENKMIVNTLGPVKGLTQKTGIQTFAGTSWATQGNAWNDLTKAVYDKLQAKKVPVEGANPALVLHPTEHAKLLKVFSSTAQTQLTELQKLLPGGIYSSLDVTAGKAYVYPKTNTVLEHIVYQDLTVVPLPRIDEDERLRVRTISAFHVYQRDGVVEITGIT